MENNKPHGKLSVSSNDNSEHDDNIEGAEVFDESEGKHPQRVKKRIRVRKRIRIRKKPSAKKKIKKYAERAFWILVIGGFIAALIVLIVELDIRDDKFKKKKKKATPTNSTY